MIKIIYAPKFVRGFSKLEKGLQKEVLEKIKLFQNPKNHERLKIHKLHGQLKNRFSFSVSYQYCVVFSFLSRNEVVFLVVGNHDVYK